MTAMQNEIVAFLKWLGRPATVYEFCQAMEWKDQDPWDAKGVMLGMMNAGILELTLDRKVRLVESRLESGKGD